jgi:uncharacterized metal-binding protein YceD (DUF177 family)
MDRWLSPRIIRLNELPDQGRTFVYSRSTGEIQAQLEDLLGDRDYSVRLQITPLGQAFRIEGQIQSGLDLQCSLCGIDFAFPLDIQINELLAVLPRLPKNGQYSRANHQSDLDESQPFCTELSSYDFDMGAFVREQIAVQEPSRPTARPDCETQCENYRALKTTGLLESQTTKSQPFDVLKGLKLNS